MAIEAKNLNMNMNNFSNQMMMNDGNRFGYVNSNVNQGFGYNMGSIPNFSPVFHQSLKAESGLTCNLPPSRKRSRDSIEQFNSINNMSNIVPLQIQNQKNLQNHHPMEFSSFLGEDFSLQIQQQQLEIDQIIAHHNKKIRMELEERQKQHSRMLISVIGENVVKKLNEKDEQIQRIAKLNMALQEKVKSLCVENQLWRDLAQTNEAAAISLRSNLEQVLAHVTEEKIDPPAVIAEDVESCCGSNDGICGRDAEEEVSGTDKRQCRKCGNGEACVLLLPCRHLCVCTACGSQLLQACPVCDSRMTATVHVNLSQ